MSETATAIALRKIREEIRNEVIEECARVADQWGYSDVALAIRALKP